MMEQVREPREDEISSEAAGFFAGALGRGGC